MMRREPNPPDCENLVPLECSLKKKVGNAAGPNFGAVKIYCRGMRHDAATYKILIKPSGLLSGRFAIVPLVGIGPWLSSL